MRGNATTNLIFTQYIFIAGVLKRKMASIVRIVTHTNQIRNRLTLVNFASEEIPKRLMSVQKTYTYIPVRDFFPLNTYTRSVDDKNNKLTRYSLHVFN